MMELLREIILESDTTKGRLFDLFVVFLVVTSVVVFSLETLPDLSPEVYLWLSRTELFIVILFTFEYILRIIVSPVKRQYIFSFWGIIDLLAILPFYLSSTAISSQGLRIFRLFRLLRIFKLLRYSDAVSRIVKAVWLVREELIVFSLITLMLLFLAALGIYHFEHSAQPEVFRSIFDSLWWAVATLTTVGYGDIYPITAGGRFFTFIVLMLGLGTVAIPTGLIASALTSIRKKNKVDD